jgi:hypothetical protein
MFKFEIVCWVYIHFWILSRIWFQNNHSDFKGVTYFIYAKGKSNKKMAGDVYPFKRKGG